MKITGYHFGNKHPLTLLGFAVALPNLHFHNQHHFFYFVDEGNPNILKQTPSNCVGFRCCSTQPTFSQSTSFFYFVDEGNPTSLNKHPLTVLGFAVAH
jgi:hypothetical protein